MIKAPVQAFIYLANRILRLFFIKLQEKLSDKLQLSAKHVLLFHKLYLYITKDTLVGVLII